MNLLRLMIVAFLTMAGMAFAGEPKAGDIETLIKQLGDEDFSVREAASKGLIKLGEPARKPLEKLLKETKDAEINNRATAIVRLLNMSKDLAALTTEERDIAQLPFKSAVSDDGTTVHYSNYGHDIGFICDFGNVRIVVEGQRFNDGSSGSFFVGEGGGSGRTGSFFYKTANGVTDVTFREINWKVEGKILKIAGQETGFGAGTNRVIFLDKTGKFKKRVDVPQEKNAGKK